MTWLTTSETSLSSISFGSSLLVNIGPEWGTIPLIVECYQHPEYKGRKVTVLRDIAHTGELGIHIGFLVFVSSRALTSPEKARR